MLMSSRFFCNQMCGIERAQHYSLPTPCYRITHASEIACVFDDSRSDPNAIFEEHPNMPILGHTGVRESHDSVVAERLREHSDCRLHSLILENSILRRELRKARVSWPIAIPQPPVCLTVSEVNSIAIRRCCHHDGDVASASASEQKNEEKLSIRFVEEQFPAVVVDSHDEVNLDDRVCEDSHKNDQQQTNHSIVSTEVTRKTRKKKKKKRRHGTLCSSMTTTSPPSVDSEATITDDELNHHTPIRPLSCHKPRFRDSSTFNKKAINALVSKRIQHKRNRRNMMQKKHINNDGQQQPWTPQSPPGPSPSSSPPSEFPLGDNVIRLVSLTIDESIADESLFKNVPIEITKDIKYIDRTLKAIRTIVTSDQEIREKIHRLFADEKHTAAAFVFTILEWSTFVRMKTECADDSDTRSGKGRGLDFVTIMFLYDRVTSWETIDLNDIDDFATSEERWVGYLGSLMKGLATSPAISEKERIALELFIKMQSDNSFVSLVSYIEATQDKANDWIRAIGGVVIIAAVYIAYHELFHDLCDRDGDVVDCIIYDRTMMMTTG